jgi:hypothetical protein
MLCCCCCCFSLVASFGSTTLTTFTATSIESPRKPKRNARHENRNGRYERSCRASCDGMGGVCSIAASMQSNGINPSRKWQFLEQFRNTTSSNISSSSSSSSSFVFLVYPCNLVLETPALEQPRRQPGADCRKPKRDVDRDTPWMA